MPAYNSKAIQPTNGRKMLLSVRRLWFIAKQAERVLRNWMMSSAELWLFANAFFARQPERVKAVKSASLRNKRPGELPKSPTERAGTFGPLLSVHCRIKSA